MNRVLVGSVAALLLIVVVGGCAAPADDTAPAGPPTSPAPAAAAAPPQFAKIDPCRLLTAAQQNEFDIFRPSGPQYETGGSYCGWGSYDINVNGNWVAKLQFGQPFPANLSTPGPTRKLQISGYQVLEGSNPSFTPTTSCVQYVNVAPNNTLIASYDAGKLAGVDHQMACATATRFSTMLIGNLNALLGH